MNRYPTATRVKYSRMDWINRLCRSVSEKASCVLDANFLQPFALGIFVGGFTLLLYNRRSRCSKASRSTLDDTLGPEVTTTESPIAIRSDAHHINHLLATRGRSLVAPELKNCLVFRVVLTGGPCGGKSSSLSHLTKELTKLGYNVYCAPEVLFLLFPAEAVDTRPHDNLELQGRVVLHLW